MAREEWQPIETAPQGVTILGRARYVGRAGDPLHVAGKLYYLVRWTRYGHSLSEAVSSRGWRWGRKQVLWQPTHWKPLLGASAA